MSLDFGVLTADVKLAGTLVAAAVALIFTWMGKTWRWEPPEETLDEFARKIVGVVCAILAGCMWYWFTKLHPPQHDELIFLVLGLLAAGVFAAGWYSYLTNRVVFEKVAGLDAKRKPVRLKIVGAFKLTEEARKERDKHSLTEQQLFAGAAYEPDWVWPRHDRAKIRVLFQVLYVVFVSCLTLSLTGAAMLVGGDMGKPDLARSLKDWNSEAERARAAGTVGATGMLPQSLVAARTTFENSWQAAGQAEKSGVEQDKLGLALGLVVRTYRIQEKDSPTQKNAFQWADIAIQHFQQTQNRKALTGAFLDKAAIYLDLTQLDNANKDDFQRNAKDGDAVVTSAVQLADAADKPSALRIASRFYYALARPQSFRLSENWDNNYLLLAVERASEAKKLTPDDIKNDNQLLRTVIKASRNPPQDTDPSWGVRLQTAQAAMKSAWIANRDKLQQRDQRLSPLSVLSTGTLEAVTREWNDTPKPLRPSKAKTLLEKLDSDGLALMRETEALLVTSELKNSHGFDVSYDIARAQAQRTVILRSIDPVRANSVFPEVLANLGRARANAKSTQLDAALKDVDRDPSFRALLPAERERVKRLLLGQ